MPDIVFPPNFRWGAATAAHQVEGLNTNNDWWAWEQQAGRIKRGHRSGLACDWWAHAEADFDRAVEMGLNAMRLSVEWSRIEPRPGEFDPLALERYAAMLRGLRERGLEPMVTLHHFTNPLWLAERGGWENPETIPLFARFAGRVVEALGAYCDLWCTVNEINVYGYAGYSDGVFPPGKRNVSLAMRVIRHMLLGHAAAYRAIHAAQPQARVGLAHNMRVLDPANPRSPLDRLASWLPARTFNELLLIAVADGRWALPLGTGAVPELRHTLDWFGLNYYCRSHVAFDLRYTQTLLARKFSDDRYELLEGDYGEYYPVGIYRFLMRLKDLGMPLYVTENGCPDSSDDQRPRYLVEHLHQIWRAIQAGCPVQGYYHWTLVDNFEWAEGWALPFGLIALDPQTQARTLRRSGELYRDIAHAGAIDLEMVQKHVPGFAWPENARCET